MILTIDIGNSTTKFGVFDDKKLIERHLIPTIRGKSANEIFESIPENLKQIFQSVIISTVVPELSEVFIKLSEKNFNCTPYFVNHEFNFRFAIKYNPPQNVGIDRLIAAFAAVQTYGKPCIICDFGTATTIDVVNSNNEYLGGIITAGLQLLADSLHQKTSKLPKVELKKPSKVIGDSTITAIQSGVYFGYIGLVEGIINKMLTELGEKPQIIATGGLARLIAEGTQTFDIVDDNLMLEGLRLIQKSLTEN
jgi:type III pantothenate kinase